MSFLSDIYKWGLARKGDVIPRSNTVVLIGHSFIANNGTADSSYGSSLTPPVFGSNALTYSKGIFERANIIMKQAFQVLSQQGVTGETSAQVLARFSSALKVNGVTPGTIYLDVASNDFYNSITAAQCISNISAMISMATSKGIRVILALDIPRGGSYTQSNIQALVQVSDYFKDYAAVTPGLTVFDQWPYFADVSTYANSYNGVPLASTVLADSIHPNALGAGVAAQALANLLSGSSNLGRRRYSCNSDGGTNGDKQIVTRNPLLIGTGGFTGTGATGTWAANTYSARLSGSAITGVGSKVSRASVAATFPGLFDDGVQGELQAVALANGAVNDLFYTSASPADLTAFAATYSGQGPFIIEAEIGVNMTSGTLSTLDLGGSFATTGGSWLTTANYNADSGDYLGLSKFQGVIRTRPFYLPAGLTTSAGTQFAQIRMGTTLNATGTVYIGNFGMRKLLA